MRSPTVNALPFLLLVLCAGAPPARAEQGDAASSPTVATTKRRVRLYKQLGQLGQQLDQRVHSSLGIRPRGMPTTALWAQRGRRATKRMSRKAPVREVLPGKGADLTAGDLIVTMTSGRDWVANQVTPDKARHLTARAQPGRTGKPLFLESRHGLTVERRPLDAGRDGWVVERYATLKSGKTKWLRRRFVRTPSGIVVEAASYSKGDGKQQRRFYQHGVDGKRKRITKSEVRRLLASSTSQINPRTKAWDSERLAAAGIQTVTITRGKHAGQTYFRRGRNFDAAKAHEQGLTFVQGHHTVRGYRQAHVRDIGR